MGEPMMTYELLLSLILVGHLQGSGR